MPPRRWRRRRWGRHVVDLFVSFSRSRRHVVRCANEMAEARIPDSAPFGLRLRPLGAELHVCTDNYDHC